MPISEKLRGKDKTATRLPVDESKLNMGNTYDSPPDYYYDIEFTCLDCGSVEVWKASRQKNGGTRKLADTFSPRRFAVEDVARRNGIVKMRRERPSLKVRCEKAKMTPDKARQRIAVGRFLWRSVRALSLVARHTEK